MGAGTLFDADIYLWTPLVTTPIENLLAWEIYLTYDQDILEVRARDAFQLLAAYPGSDVIDVSEGLPDNDGLYRIAAADIGGKAAESGSGVLVRLTLRAKANGFSDLELPHVDFDGDGAYDLGPFLNNDSGEKINDSEGDGFFDGPVSNARVAVGRSCASLPPLPSPTPGAISDLGSPSPTSTQGPEAGTTPEGSPTGEPADGGTPESPVPEDTPESPGTEGTPPPATETPGGPTPNDSTPSTDQTPASGGESSGPGTGIDTDGSGDGSDLIWIIGALVATAAVLSGGVLLFVARRGPA
ncbi:MAG: hypothetical protein A2V88_07485 [Elusimicrobia bacterium RBG_16_66_12]|nr:MAG: hypothetical protein A2V88_07485 [Elusimicrobia bacterium RBG_16_66_12]